MLVPSLRHLAGTKLGGTTGPPPATGGRSRSQLFSRFERVHDSGDMEAQTPQEEVFFDCEHPNVYQGICMGFRC